MRLDELRELEAKLQGIRGEVRRAEELASRADDAAERAIAMLDELLSDLSDEVVT